MKSSLQDLPVTMETPQGVAQAIEWGGMTVSTGEINQTIDLTPLLKGLPDDRCQCPHWGYVLKGRVRAIFSDQEEVYSEGDVFYIPPGHSVVYEAGTQFVDFSPSDELSKSQEVIARNFQAMME